MPKIQYWSGATWENLDSEFAQEAENSNLLDNKNAPNGNIVGDTDEQTLTNKTLISPTLNGSPTAPTPAEGDSSTLIATTAFVNTTAVSKIQEIQTEIDEVNSATVEPTGFIRSNLNTIGIIEYSPNGVDIYKVDQNSNFSKRSDSKFATGTLYEIAATAKTLVMYPVAGETSFIVYEKGIRYEFDTLQSVTVTGSVDKSHFYFFNNGVLTHYNAITGNMIAEKPIVVLIYTNEATGDIVVFGDERHGIQMDGSTHQYLHSTFGTRFKTLSRHVQRVWRR